MRINNGVGLVLIAEKKIEKVLAAVAKKNEPDNLKRTCVYE